MEYRKERNLFIAAEGNKIKGQYDSATGVYYGAKGTPIQTMPSAFKNSIYSYIFTSHQWIITHVTDETLTRALNRWECLASLGLYTSDHEVLTDANYDFPVLKKDLVNYIKEHSEAAPCYSEELRKKYELSISCPEYNMLTGQALTVVNHTIFEETQFPLEWFIKAMLKYQLDDVSYLGVSPWTYAGYLEHYYEQCAALNIEPVITKNMFATMGHTAHLYNNYKKANMNNDIKRFNDIPELYYENDTYIVRPLLSTEEFHAEAEAQQNCVERLYMERVADGNTHVVTVRKKDAPTQSLITCEISNNFNIIQYYAKYNRIPDGQDMQFKKELTRYLSSLSQK